MSPGGEKDSDERERSRSPIAFHPAAKAIPPAQAPAARPGAGAPPRGPPVVIESSSEPTPTPSSDEDIEESAEEDEGGSVKSKAGKVGTAKRIRDIFQDPAALAVIRNEPFPLSKHLSGKAKKKEIKRAKQQARAYMWVNGEVWRKDATGRVRRVPPPAARAGLIETYHTRLGHQGRDKTYAMLAQEYVWHDMAVNVRALPSLLNAACPFPAAQRATPPSCSGHHGAHTF
jgi:hypothetical protein